MAVLSALLVVARWRGGCCAVWIDARRGTLHSIRGGGGGGGGVSAVTGYVYRFGICGRPGLLAV